LLTTLRFFGLLAGFLLMTLQGRAQTNARPSSFLLSSGNSEMENYVISRNELFAKIDRHAFEVSGHNINNPEELSQALCPDEFSEMEKVRSIYSWMAKNIVYDENGLRNNQLQHQTAEDVFKNRLGVCEGFSNLFLTLCSYANIEARFIQGYAKEDYFSNEKIIVFPNHAWNSVQINGKWHLLDVTWASLNKNLPDWNLSDNTNVEYKLEANFLIDPETFILTHLPEDPSWQLLPVPVAFDEFYEEDFLIKSPETKIDVHERIDYIENLDSIDRELYLSERMVVNHWNKLKEYRLGIAYYFKAQQLYRMIGKMKGNAKNEVINSIRKNYQNSLDELRKLNSNDFGFKHAKDLIPIIESRRDLIMMNNS